MIEGAPKGKYGYFDSCLRTPPRVSDAAVRKAIAAGRITPEADGTIDAERVDREWARNSDAPRNGTATRAVKVAVPESSGPTGDGHRSRGQHQQVARPCCKRGRSTKWSRRKPTRCVWPASGRAGRSAAGHRPCFQAGALRTRCLAQLARTHLGTDGSQARRRSPHDAHRLEAAVREHLQELGEMRPRVD